MGAKSSKGMGPGMPHFQRAIVVGATSGIGLALAQRLVSEGAGVALVGRSGEKLQRATGGINMREKGQGAGVSYGNDVHNTEEIPALFQEIVQDLGGLDLIIYAAGIMPKVAPDDYDTATDREIIDTNLIGAMAWLNEAAARFAQLGSGTIVGISSVAGDRGRRGNPAYCASKAALATYLESLRNRLGSRGVTVVTVKPGYVATAMTAGEKLPKFLPVIKPERAAELILAAAQQKRQVAYVPEIWRPIMAIIRAIPSRIFQRLNI
jgi:decaprenylphospho-beta-D-erythro-pentofuranosid-2-ulose 2-reductase